MARQAIEARQIKEDVLRWLNSLRSRRATYSFRLVQDRLRAQGMPSATGWKPLMARYEELNYANETTDWAEYVSTLTALHKCSVLYGSTVVWLFDAPAGDVADMAKHAGLLLDTTSPFAASFPHPVSESVLMRQAFKAKFVNLRRSKNGDVYVIGCAKRAFRHREQIDVSDLSESSQEDFNDFQELYGIRAGWTQAYDRLYFRPNKNRFEIHVDLCCPLNADELQQAQVAYITQVKNVMEKELRRPLPWLNQPRNLFPLIDKLYQEVDGRVISMGHATGSKSIKEERMRGRRLDLREEPFHIDGIKAIGGTTDAYSIKKGWPNGTHGNVPSVFIPGRPVAVGIPAPAMRRAVIENCAHKQDFEMILEKLA
jgi:hypothetical protein